MTARLALERHERGDARVIPVILRPVYWQGAPFGKLQALPKDAKAILSRDWPHIDEAFFDVAEGIRKVALEIYELATRALLSTENNTASILTAQMVVDSWGNVQKRVKQRSNGARLSAHLSYFNIVAIEGTAEQPVVVMQANASVHYDYLQENERYKDVEWALRIEFVLDCRVRLIPPKSSSNNSLLANVQNQ